MTPRTDLRSFVIIVTEKQKLWNCFCFRFTSHCCNQCSPPWIKIKPGRAPSRLMEDWRPNPSRDHRDLLLVETADVTAGNSPRGRSTTVTRWGTGWCKASLPIPKQKPNRRTWKTTEETRADAWNRGGVGDSNLRGSSAKCDLNLNQLQKER